MAGEVRFVCRLSRQSSVSTTRWVVPSAVILAALWPPYWSLSFTAAAKAVPGTQLQVGGKLVVYSEWDMRSTPSRMLMAHERDPGSSWCRWMRSVQMGGVLILCHRCTLLCKEITILPASTSWLSPTSGNGPALPAQKQPWAEGMTQVWLSVTVSTWSVDYYSIWLFPVLLINNNYTI